MNTYNVKPGTTILAVERNLTFTLTKVTDKRVSWSVRQPFKSLSTGKNTMTKVWMSFKEFNRYVEIGMYVIQK